jgi:CheY-like chemotaxis protein
MSKATILLVDHDRDFLEIMTAYLQNQGYQVIATQNLLDAKKKLELEKIDLVVFDLGLADDEDGEVLFELVLTREFSATLPKILRIDSFRNPKLRHILYNLGASAQITTEYVQKLDGLSAHLATIESLLKLTPESDSAPEEDSALKEGGSVFHSPVRAESRVFIYTPEEVFFTAYHPKEGKVDTWHTLLVYAHLLSALGTVRKDAKRFDQEIKTRKETTSAAFTRIVRGTEITIVPACEGITFNPERITLKWMEDFHRAEFRFKADQSLVGDAAKGHISIYAGPLLIGTLKFAMLFNETESPTPIDHEEQAKMYSKDAIFISYSHQDTDFVLYFRNILEATGYDVLIDIDDLRSGQIWNDELRRMIERADIFQLFWSSNSSQSKYCQQEWEHALKQNRPEGYIRPVYWQKPLPKPPDKLSKFHFTYVELKMPTVDAS